MGSLRVEIRHHFADCKTIMLLSDFRNIIMLSTAEFHGFHRRFVARRAVGLDIASSWVPCTVELK